VEASYSTEYEYSYPDSMVLTNTQMIRNSTERTRKEYPIAEEEMVQTENLHHALEKFVLDQSVLLMQPSFNMLSVKEILNLSDFKLY
jgi:hypothetical protein